MTKNFSRCQESARKDVERAFDVLQKRFAVIRANSRLWSVEDMALVMKCCLILHNMIVESERNDAEYDRQISEFLAAPDDCMLASNSLPFERMDTFIGDNYTIIVNAHTLSKYSAVLKNEENGRKLKAGMIQHLWNCRGEEILLICNVVFIS